ncbi:hypothetical protein [Nesterenkonia sandarakina]|uniref:hypothetical protein n=1 Tax=Nesterenkonia sandarakina TaxID=272918 RepID=UPI0011B215DD|nr:hypothetical protein [Nesterenkonia sandarakina]
MVLPLPVLVGSLLIPDDQFLPLFGQPSFLDEATRATALAYLVIMLVIFVVLVPMRGRAVAEIALDATAVAWLERVVKVLAFITFTAYAVWIGNALLRGLRFGTMLQLLSGEAGTMYVLRGQYFESISGVTTWMQLGAILAPLAVLRERATGRSARRLVGVLLFLAFARALLNSERLALIEIVLSVAIAYFVLRREAPSWVRRPVSAGLLVVGSWLVLFGVFSAFEFFRSWTSAQASFDGDFSTYAATLLLGYYATALNLAAFDGYVLGSQLAPGQLFDGSLWESLFGASPVAGVQQAYGLETFTNRSGLLVPQIAFGEIGGALVVVATALLLAVLARWTARGHVVAFALYCASCVGVLEIVRIYYFGSSRFLPVAVAGACMAISWALVANKRRQNLRYLSPPLENGTRSWSR